MVTVTRGSRMKNFKRFLSESGAEIFFYICMFSAILALTVALAAKGG